MSVATTLPQNRYAELVSAAEPQIIHSKQVYRQHMKVLRELAGREESLTKDERKLFELLATLVEDYEKRTFRVHGATPIQIIQLLMDANDLKQKDMVGVFETASVISDVLSGKRGLTLDHIKRLSERFHVSPIVFF